MHTTLSTGEVYETRIVNLNNADGPGTQIAYAKRGDRAVYF